VARGHGQVDPGGDGEEGLVGNRGIRQNPKFFIREFKTKRGDDRGYAYHCECPAIPAGDFGAIMPEDGDLEAPQHKGKDDLETVEK